MKQLRKEYNLPKKAPAEKKPKEEDPKKEERFEPYYQGEDEVVKEPKE